MCEPLAADADNFFFFFTHPYEVSDLLTTNSNMLFLFYILDIVLSYNIITYIPACVYTLLKVIYSYGTKLGRTNDDKTFIFE